MRIKRVKEPSESVLLLEGKRKEKLKKRKEGVV
jgi:hypothetical protein